MHWLILAVGICAEVMATTAMKLTDGFKKIWPWAFVMAGFFALALYLLSLTLETLPVGPVYAIWSGSGVALISIVGHYLFKQVMDRPAQIGIALIIAGVVVLQLFSTTVPH